jgi:hypothetical protein
MGCWTDCLEGSFGKTVALSGWNPSLCLYIAIADKGIEKDPHPHLLVCRR